MSIHSLLGVALIVVAAVGAVLIAVARNRADVLASLRVFVRLCGALAAVEAAVGVVLLVTGNRPAEGIHFFYGAATVIPIPAAELLARRAGARDEWLYLLAGAAATALFGLRAVTTGSM